MATNSVTPAPVLQPATSPRQRVEDLLCRVRAYRVVRNTYQLLFNREYHLARVRDKAFFRQFVPTGGLVFDIGANQGRLTQVFAEIGARVVAVEPNPALTARVRARYGSARVTVEGAAIGDQEGTAELSLGRDSGHSTLSTDWQDAIGDAATDRWDGSVEVPVTTLDALIARHGRPDFVKIDVEGFEPQVLSGLHEPVDALSFEFLCAAPELAPRCIERIRALGHYEFNLARGEEHDLAPGEWTGPDEILARLDELRAADPESYGDVYARLRR
jgi:FkbM family methyltransferase